MAYRCTQKCAKAIAILGLLYAPAYLADKFREIPSLKYVNKCRTFQNALFENYKLSKNIYEAYNHTIMFSNTKPVGIECLIVESDLVPTKDINILASELEPGKNIFYYQTGSTYGQRVIQGLKGVISEVLSKKMNANVEALKFEFKR